MVTYAFNLAGWTLLFFILGMIKPQWPLFFLKKPDRFLVMIITIFLVMATFTLYGEGTQREKLAQETKAIVPQDSVSHSTPVPVPVPTPDKIKP